MRTQASTPAAIAVLLLTVIAAATPIKANDDNRVEFDLTDQPGYWFDNVAGAIAGTRSLAVARPGVEVRFSGRSHTVHTMSSLLYPAGAARMPFDTDARKGSASVVLHTRGLYVFVCKIHPYMLSAVIVDDPATRGLDLGDQITVLDGPTVPTSSDLATRLLRTFFIATNPANWQNFANSRAWHITYPSADVRITGGAVVNLADVLSRRYGNDTALPPLFTPAIPGSEQRREESRPRGNFVDDELHGPGAVERELRVDLTQRRPQFRQRISGPAAGADEHESEARWRLEHRHVNIRKLHV